MKFKDLSRVQQAIIIALRYGEMPKFVKLKRAIDCIDKKRQAVQDNHMAWQKKAIGDKNARRTYWINRLTNG